MSVLLCSLLKTSLANPAGSIFAHITITVLPEDYTAPGQPDNLSNGFTFSAVPEKAWAMTQPGIAQIGGAPCAPQFFKTNPLVFTPRKPELPSDDRLDPRRRHDALIVVSPAQSELSPGRPRRLTSRLHAFAAFEEGSGGKAP